MKYKNLIYSGIVLIVLIGIMFALFSPSNITNIDSNVVKELLEGESMFVLQVHEPYIGEIPNTDLVISNWNNVEDYESQLPVDTDTPLLVYCRSGRMSSIVSQKLEDMGYTNIYHLENGMNEWQSTGNELIKRNIKEFEIEVGNWYFSPENIEVTEGDYIRITFNVVDGYHSVSIPEFGISKILQEGEEVLVEFIANKKGEFNFFCNVPCGSGHREMEGALIVK